jgi:hypothetical protein
MGVVLRRWNALAWLAGFVAVGAIAALTIPSPPLAERWFEVRLRRAGAAERLRLLRGLDPRTAWAPAFRERLRRIDAGAIAASAAGAFERGTLKIRVDLRNDGPGDVLLEDLRLVGLGVHARLEAVVLAPGDVVTLRAEEPFSAAHGREVFWVEAENAPRPLFAGEVVDDDRAPLGTWRFGAQRVPLTPVPVTVAGR